LLLYISIPLWDDWKNIAQVCQLLNVIFQFHYGMIGSFACVEVEVGVAVFQFHYGMIGSLIA